jgi:hypothetical protein
MALIGLCRDGMGSGGKYMYRHVGMYAKAGQRAERLGNMYMHMTSPPYMSE